MQNRLFRSIRSVSVFFCCSLIGHIENAATEFKRINQSKIRNRSIQCVITDTTTIEYNIL